MGKLKVFFAGSMYGGREDEALYKGLIDEIKKRYELLSDHVGYGDPKGLEDNEIFKRDMRLIEESSLLIAEVSTPSIGVGYEIAGAINSGKAVICLYREGSKAKLSPMVNGNPGVIIVSYRTKEEALAGIDKAVSSI